MLFKALHDLRRYKVLIWGVKEPFREMFRRHINRVDRKLRQTRMDRDQSQPPFTSQMTDCDWIRRDYQHVQLSARPASQRSALFPK